MIVVGDISPLAALGRTGRLELLRKLQREVLVPECLRDELSRAGQRLPWFVRVVRPTHREYIDELRSWLDGQEAEAIALYKESNANFLLMDEHLGRKLARREGVRTIGLMGVLIAAKRAGLISSVRDVLSEIKRACGYRISDRVEQAMFASVGEAAGSGRPQGNAVVMG